MPDDTYNGLYIHKELVKGNWYGISSGPKPQEFTGNIDDDPESLRNKALVILSPSSANGTFPTSAYGHECAVLTTRYGEGVYLQNLFDTQDNIEYDRVCLNWTSKSSWRDWQRVTTEGDASSLAQSADTRSRNNETAITQINTAIGGRTASPNIDSRVSSNATKINNLTTDFNNFKNSTNGSITSLNTNVTKALDHSNKLINGDVRTGQKAGMKFYANQNEFTLNSPESSVIIIEKSVCDSWGANSSNSMFFVSNANSNVSPVHIDGGTFVPNLGWAAVFDRNYTGRIIINWMLVVIDQAVT